jgi:hypothetical protein
MIDDDDDDDDDNDGDDDRVVHEKSFCAKVGFIGDLVFLK